MYCRDAWPGQLTNTPALTNMSAAQDQLYLDVTLAANKTYKMPVSTWCEYELTATDFHPAESEVHS